MRLIDAVVAIGSAISRRTGTRGDHASPQNEFRLAVVCHDSGTQDVRADAAARAGLTVSARDGSRPGGYQLPFRVHEACERGTVAVLDQRNWGGCVDFEAALPLGVARDALRNEAGERLFAAGDGVLLRNGTAVCESGTLVGDGRTEPFDCESSGVSGGVVFLILLVLALVACGATVAFLKLKRPEQYKKFIHDPVISKISK